MPTPKRGYFTADGKRVPSVTTILSRFKESGGLMQWAFQQGADGRAHLYEEAEKAAEIGTVAHAMVEMRVKGDGDVHTFARESLPDPEMLAKATSAFTAYETWAANFGVRITHQEIQLVSEKHRFGGTPDAFGIIGNQLVCLDWKTSNAVYSDYLIQLAAYGKLWEENFPDQPITGGYHLLRFSKENGDFAHHYYASLETEWRQFLLFREAYELDKAIKKRAA
jgi:hypothetical protein